MSDAILLIDDDEALTQVLARAFRKRGYDAVQANTSTAAMTAVREQVFERCVLDLKLANDSGLPLIAKLKEKQPQLNIVMLTGYSSINTAVEAIKLGASNYLCKPADADEILAAFDAEPDADVAISNTPISVNRLEWEHIQKVLAEHDGNVSATARALGMHRRTLQRKLQKKPVRQ